MVSICMASFNGGKYIKEQIDSILVQLEEEDEIIISDDGSVDNTIEIINSYNDPRIKLFHHCKNPDIANMKHSQSYYFATDNFENAIRHARGDYIFLSDQDDVWTKNRIKIFMDTLQHCDFAICNLIPVNNELEQIGAAFYRKNPIPKSAFFNIIKPCASGCCMAFHKKLLPIILPFPRLLICHDLWITCLAIKFLKCGYINEVLHLYRRNDSNVSTTGKKSSNSIFYKIWYRLIVFSQYKTRCIQIGNKYGI